MRTGSRDPQSSYACVEFDIFDNFIVASFISYYIGLKTRFYQNFSGIFPT